MTIIIYNHWLAIIF